MPLAADPTLHPAIASANQAEAEGQVDRAQALLDEALAAARGAEERGALHAALAVHWGRRLAYRKMNAHERASALAFAELDDELAKAIATYEKGVSLQDPTEIVEHVRRAREVLLSKLAEHPFTIQATRTLAGRLSDIQGALPERSELYQELLSWHESTFGYHNTTTAKARSDLAYLLRALWQPREALDAWEAAFDVLIEGPWPGSAGPVLTEIARISRSLGEPARTASREERFCERSEEDSHVVREIRLMRTPDLRRRFNRDVLVHAASHFPGMLELWAWPQDNPPLALARLQARHAQAAPGSPEALFLSAMLMQANLEADHVEGDDSDSVAFTVWCAVEMREECTAGDAEAGDAEAGDAEAGDPLASPPRPLADAEYEWQARHFLELWAAWTEKAKAEPAG